MTGQSKPFSLCRLIDELGIAKLQAKWPVALLEPLTNYAIARA
jgi:hypothetical protein